MRKGEWEGVEGMRARVGGGQRGEGWRVREC